MPSNKEQNIINFAKALLKDNELIKDKAIVDTALKEYIRTLNNTAPEQKQSTKESNSLYYISAFFVCFGIIILFILLGKYEYLLPIALMGIGVAIFYFKIKQKI